MTESMQLTFDLETGQKVGALSMALAAARREDLLDLARRTARELALANPDRYVTADEVQKRLLDLGMPPGALGNAAGSIFRNRSYFHFSGHWRYSRRVSNHGRAIRVWLYIGS